MKFAFIVNPLSQFEINRFLSFRILDYNILNITNIGLYLMLGIVILITMNLFLLSAKEIPNTRWSMMKESIYGSIKSIVISQIGYIKGQIYMPYIYMLFMFILLHNLIGMVPYSFASTSHFLLTFTLSFVVVLGSTILGFYTKKSEFFANFVPSGCPLGLLPLLVLIELVSYIARHVSLGLRLGANITAGHMLLYILSSFTYNMMKVYIFAVWALPLIGITAFSGLEVGIAIIQAQVFVILSSSYIKDGV